MYEAIKIQPNTFVTVTLDHPTWTARSPGSRVGRIAKKFPAGKYIVFVRSEMNLLHKSGLVQQILFGEIKVSKHLTYEIALGERMWHAKPEGKMTSRVMGTMS